jgi:hypothetical protein
MLVEGVLFIEELLEVIIWSFDRIQWRATSDIFCDVLVGPPSLISLNRHIFHALYFYSQQWMEKLLFCENLRKKLIPPLKSSAGFLENPTPG